MSRPHGLAQHRYEQATSGVTYTDPAAYGGTVFQTCACVLALDKLLTNSGFQTDSNTTPARLTAISRGKPPERRLGR